VQGVCAFKIICMRDKTNICMRDRTNICMPDKTNICMRDKTNMEVGVQTLTTVPYPLDFD